VPSAQLAVDERGGPVIASTPTTLATQAPPVYGLILAGGTSSRMQQDKAVLLYEGRPQLDRAFDLLSSHLREVFVSVRADQLTDPARAGKPQIIDSVSGGGPIVGIRSALAHTPGVAWLVLACDLPFLSDITLKHLLGCRDPQALATAYRSTHDSLPEPLCAIWEPTAGAALAEYQATGGRCPRKFLIRHQCHLVEAVEPAALDNINTPDEYAQALNQLDSGVLAAAATSSQTSRMKLHIQFYAVLREQAGCSDLPLETIATTPQDLYSELRSRYAFTLAPEQLRVAVNGEFAEWSVRLKNGDAVVFIPPVAGG